MKIAVFVCRVLGNWLMSRYNSGRNDDLRKLALLAYYIEARLRAIAANR